MIHAIALYFYLDPKLGSHGEPRLDGARLGMKSYSSRSTFGNEVTVASAVSILASSTLGQSPKIESLS